MKTRDLILLISGIVCVLLYSLFSTAVSEIELIWILTRILGLLAYTLLFVTIVLGELMILIKARSRVNLARYHNPAGIFTVFLVVLHFVSAVADNYKWGKGLSFIDYLGFSFSDKWLTLLSLGTLSAYLLLVVALTSSSRSMRFFGFRKWKMVHFISYLLFVFVFVHSMMLGTDLKTSYIYPVLSPLFIFSFIFVMVLLLVRVIDGFRLFPGAFDMILFTVFVLILITGLVFLVSSVSKSGSRIAEVQGELYELNNKLHVYQQENDALAANNSNIQSELNKIVANRLSIQSDIDGVKNE